MEYIAAVHPEDGEWVVTFPDCPGCVTQVEQQAESISMAREALEGWLEAHLAHGEAPPRPAEHRRAPKGARLIAVPISLTLSAQLSLRWARQDAGLTQAALAKRVGIGQPQIAKLELPGSNPSLQTLEKVMRALGARLDLRLLRPRHQSLLVRRVPSKATQASMRASGRGY
ncbi:MAG: helix-turn-helix domain-containing protein [Deltaproteobacteria bacterium]